jgi:hypothetical protein
MLVELGDRRGFLGGGKGMGGSAGLVFSYRRPTRAVSSRKYGRRPLGERLFCRTEANLVGNILKEEEEKTKSRSSAPCGVWPLIILVVVPWSWRPYYAAALPISEFASHTLLVEPDAGVWTYQI